MTANPTKVHHRRGCPRPNLQVRVGTAGTRRSCPECGRYAFTPAEAPQQPLTTAQARDLAAELIRDLTPHAGDPDAVRAVLLEWLETEYVPRLSMACMSAVQQVFADCLFHVPVDQMPPGALALNPPTERTAA